MEFVIVGAFLIIMSFGWRLHTICVMSKFLIEIIILERSDRSIVVVWRCRYGVIHWVWVPGWRVSHSVMKGAVDVVAWGKVDWNLIRWCKLSWGLELMGAVVVVWFVDCLNNQIFESFLECFVVLLDVVNFLIEVGLEGLGVIPFFRGGIEKVLNFSHHVFLGFF